MGRKLDRTMYTISVIYISLPIFIFLAGWLRLAVSIPICAVFLTSVFFTVKNRPEPIEWHLSRRQWGVVFASLILLSIWVFLSGQGGFSFQNSDYQYRNAIFHDLIERPWPVVFDYTAQNTAANSSIASTSNLAVLTYYIAFWLPGALVGKFFGWYAANVFLYFWSYVGVVLITYYMFRTLRTARIGSVLILIFFSGMDVLGYFLMSKGQLPGAIEHIEWWSGLQYSSNTTLLFWVFNQTITIWLAILLILNIKNSRSLFFLYSMLLLHGPFPFLGMLPIVLWKAYQGFPLPHVNGKYAWQEYLYALILWFWRGVRRAITFENIAGGVSVLSIVYIYLMNNISGSKYGINKLSPNYYIFIIFEFGLYLLILFMDHPKKPLFWICLISLLVIPFFKIGTSQDFCMRVSIPALFVLQIMVQQTLFVKKEEVERIETGTPPEELETVNEKQTVTSRQSLSPGEMKFIRAILVVMLFIGTVVPIQEISRSAVYTLPAYPVTKSAMISLGNTFKDSGNHVLISAGDRIIAQSKNAYIWSDNIKTLGNDMSTAGNFLGLVHDNLFYTYLARH